MASANGIFNATKFSFIKAVNDWSSIFRPLFLLCLLLLTSLSAVNAQLYTKYSDTVCTNTTAGTVNNTITQAALPASDVNLIIWAEGDLGASSEFFDIYSENSSYLGRFDKSNECGPIDSISLTVPQDSFAAWVADGSVDFTSQASGAVDGNVCNSGLCVYMIAEYQRVKVPNDAGITAINQGVRTCAGSENILVDVVNSGNNQITSLDVNWSVNGVLQTPYSISSTLDTVGGAGNSSLQVNLGNQTFAPGGSYDIKAWTSQPNGSNDTINFNDTIRQTVVVALNGAYTIGGTSPDYADFTSAVNDLKNRGVCGPVNFSVRDGVYNEAIEIGAIPGIKAANAVSFEGENSDSSLVTLTNNAPSSSDNYTLRLNNARHLSFRHLTIEATNNSYGRAVEYQGSCDSISFYNNILRGVSTSSTSDYRSIVLGENDRNENLVFRNNRFEDGSHAIFFNTSQYSRDVKLIDNDIVNPYNRGIFIEDISYPRVDSNSIVTNSTEDYFIGIELYDCDTAVSVQNNIVRGAHGGEGITVDNSNNPNPQRGLIANNFVQIGSGTDDAIGIMVDYAYSLDVVHNTVNVTSDNSNNEAFIHYYGDDIKVLNNIFASETGYAYYTNDPFELSRSDYNALYSKGDLAYWDNTAVADMAALRAASNMDSNSIEENPYFISDTSFVVAQVSLNNAATPFSRVTVDIQGESRSATTPDIGADEFVPTGTDAGVIAVEVPNKPFAPGNYAVKAVLKNYGGSNLTSVTLDWEKNDTLQSSVNWTGNLASGDTTWVTLGSVNFISGKLNNFEVYSSNPNSSADPININDTVARNNVVAALGGTYTIGGTTPDYSNFSEAVQALNLGGVYAAVTFNARSGTYNEQFAISEILRNDTLHTVTFQSELGDSSAVTVDYSTSSSDNFVVQLNGARHVIFKDLTLYANSSYSDGRVVHIDSGSAYLSFENMVMKSNTYTSSSIDKALVYSDYQFEDEYLRFEQIHFQNGSYGLYLDSDNNPREDGIEVIDCFFDNQYWRGIDMQYLQDPQVIGNRIEPNTNSDDSYIGVYWDDVYEGNFEANRVIGRTYADNGVRFYDVRGNPGAPTLVANNFIQVGRGISDYGVSLDDCHYIDLIHNTVLVSGGDNNTAALLHEYSNLGLNIYNNIFQNIAGGYAYYSDVTYGIDNSDHNNLFVTGTNLGHWNGDITDLSSWISTTNLDSNSLSVEALFTDTTDLHTNTANLNAAATPIASVTLDIDGDPRDPATPDIGADEFSVPTDDAALNAFQNPLEPFAAGSQDVMVQLYNNGADTLYSTTIQWEVNGVSQPAYSWTGALPSGQSLDSVIVGSFNFQFDSIYSLKAWTELPNNTTDAQPLNDTIEIFDLYPALQGVYTIGGTTPDFTDFNAAVQALHSRGIAGWVTFNVRDGNYNEQIKIDEYLGASSSDTVLFQSENQDSSLVKLHNNPGSSDNYVVFLNGADHVSFKNLSIQNPDNYYGRNVQIDSGAHHNNFINVAFLSDPNSTTTSYNAALIRIESGFANNHNHFSNCLFKGGSYGITLFAEYNAFAVGNQVVNSRFEDQYYMGLRLDEQRQFVLSGSQVRHSSGYSSFYAFYANEADEIMVSKNELESTRYGAMLDDFNGSSSNPSIFKNNFIYLKGSSSGFGIELDASDHARVVHNSVLVTNSNTNTSAFYDGNNSNAEVFNNIFQNTGGGYAVDYNYSYTNTISDHNSLFATGSYLGHWDNTDVSDLSGWISASQLDSNSVSADAQFTADTNLHASAAQINAAAQKLNYVTEDIDGEARDPQNPDIGADEFTPNPNDVSLISFEGPVSPFPEGNQTVYLTLLNNGADTLNSTIIEWTVNGIAQPSYNWTGTLPSGATLDSIPVGTYNFAPNTYHDIVAWTSFPNSSSDANPSNDTLVEQDLYPALQGVYTIGGSTPDFNNFTGAVNALQIAGITGWVTFDVRPGDYQEQIAISEVTGATSTDTVLFKSEAADSSQVSLSHSGSSGSEHTLLIDGADYISFKDITIRGLNSNYAYAVLLDGQTSQNYFDGCTFWVNQSGSFYEGTSGFYSENNETNSNLHITNSQFLNGTYGFFGDGHFSDEMGLVLRDNKFSNQTSRGIFLDDYVAPNIQGNEIVTNVNNGSYHGIWLDDILDGMRLVENKVYSPFNGEGIYIDDFNGNTSFRGLMANNFVSVSDSNNSNDHAVNISSSDYLDIYYNSVLNDSATGYALYLQSNSNLELKNNSIVHLGSGHALYVNNTSQFSGSDYNNLYSTGSNLVYSGVDLANLNAWQNQTGLDGNSISADPMYQSAKDLHVALSQLDSSATPLSEVTTDIDGQTRDASTPDIGADEVLFFPDDITINKIVNLSSGCDLPDSSQVSVKVTNRGSDPQSGFDLVMVLGADTTRETIGTTISGGGSITYTFGSYVEIAAIGAYDFTFWSELSSDVDASNDTLKKTIFNFPTPNLTVSDDTTICQGEMVNLQANGGTNYSWSDGSNGASIFVSPTDTTLYTVTVTDVNGCTATDSVKVSVTTPGSSASIMADNGTTVCYRDSLLLYSTSANNISWSTGETNDSIYVKEGGTYFLNFNQPGSQCDQLKLDSITVNLVKDSIEIKSLQTICLGDAAILSATNFNGGTWSTGATSQTITVYPTEDSSFYATWMGSGGCQFTDTVTISVKPALPPAPVSNMTPVDGSFNLQKPVNLSWSPSANAVIYDLYVWEKGSSRPNFPSQGNISGITASLNNLDPGKDYYWQIAAENSCFYTYSDTLEFGVVGIPDLTIDSLSVPSSALSGTNVTITYTVKNIGERSTGSTSWEDHIWLSTDEDLRRADDILLTKVSNLTYLDTGQSYTNTVTVQLPQGALSTHLLFVSADNDDAYCATLGWVCYPGAPRKSHNSGMNELNEENNYAYDTLPITPSPSPDLIVESLGAASSAIGGDYLPLTVNIKNQGDKRADIADIGMCYFISPDSLLSSNAIALQVKNYQVVQSNVGIASGGGGGGGSSSSGKVVKAGASISIPQNEWLDPDSTKNKSIEVEIPDYLNQGKYYLHAVADCGDDIFEGLYEGNNIFSSRPLDVFPPTPPDIVTQGPIQLADTAFSGTKTSIFWQGENVGAAQETYSWTDSVFLCSSPTFNYDSVVASAKRYSYASQVWAKIIGGGTVSYGAVAVNKIELPIQFQIPNGISGDYYLFIKADANNNFYEFQYENNNLRSDTIHIELTPYPDLQVTDMTVPAMDTIYADSINSLQWQIKNLGIGPTVNTWKDQVYLSNTADPYTGSKNRLGSYTYSSPLQAGDSASRSINFKVPNFSAGVYYFEVHTDKDDDQYEHQNENNNRYSSSAIDPDGVYLKPRPVVNTPSVLEEKDLEALSVSAPSSANSGNNISVSWSVINNGSFDIGSGGYWRDAIYLSTDATLDNSDIKLTDKAKSGPVLNGNTYSATSSVKIPNGISGNYHLLVKTNYQNRLSDDTLKTNNVASQALTVNMTPPPDLQISSFSLPQGNVYGGQQMYLYYTVTNDGTGPINSGTWKDAFYLNSIPGLSSSKIFIGNDTVSRNLAVGASYTDSILINLPQYASGNYYLVLKTDDQNKVYEHNSESNNDFAQAIFINSAAQLQTDLVLTDVSAPDSMLLGYEYTINYDYTNQGSTPALGNLRNGFYFGAGTAFNSATDQLFGTSNRTISQSAGATSADSIESRVQSINTGNYYGITRLNINAAISETSLSNNDSTLPGQINVDAEELVLGVADSNTLDLDKPVYYKVNVSAGQDMRVSLNSAETRSGINELFVAYNRVPTSSDFDYKHQGAPGLNQDVLISNTQAGTYYILASTQSSFTQTVTQFGNPTTQPIDQDVTVKAELIPFSILSVSPNVVGQGVVTTKLLGGGFRDSATVTLEDGSGTTVATASISNFVNSTEIDVSWDLTSVAVGTYDVVITNPDNSSASLTDGLEVEVSSGFRTNMAVNAPQLLRVGKSGFYTFFIQNDGNVDIPYVRAQISVRDYANPTSYSANSPKIFLPSDMNKPVFQVSDWKTYGPEKGLPFVVRDLKPGERVSIDVTFKNFPYSRFPYRLRSVASDVPTFVEGTAQMMELLRQAVLRDEDSISDPQVLDMLYDREAFQDTMFAFLIEQGLLDSDDTIGVNTSCSSCNNGYDISPGASPGIAKYSNLKLKPGENMLWEINHPEGAAGAELGWDIIEVRDSIIVNATASNPFQIDLQTLSSWNDQPDFLTTWSPGYDHCWPIMVANSGITGFAASKFVIDHSGFSNNTPLHGGSFQLQLSPGGDTLYLCFNAATPAIGAQGFPGGDGHYGQDGGRGGPGGPCDANTPPGPGGPGGKGGRGVGGYLPPGKGGQGGPGGECSGGSYQGGAGGIGGQGGLGGDGQNGGPGGPGGEGGYPGGDGGDGGDGGPADDDGGPGPGGDPGDGDDDPGPDGDDGDDGEDGDDGPGPNDPNNPNNDPNPPKRPDIPPNGPPGGPKRPTGPGNPPPSPPGPTPAGCSGGGGGNPYDRCDEWNDLNGKLGCSATAYGCGKDIVIGTAAAGGAGAAVAVGGCLLGTYNCVTGGNVYTNCAEAAYNTLTGSAVGATAAGSSCLQNLLCDDSEVRSSCDPNEIKGPPGYGADQYVAADEDLDYTIYFENDSAMATTAAQVVEVRQKIHPNVDPFSLELTEFGFANMSFQIPNVPNYSTTLDLTDTLGVDVRLVAGIDVANNELFWIFESIDKQTGVAPYDPLAGFLAVNDSTGSGEGYVKYTINPASGVSTGDSITAQADIIFDVNSSITTNTWFNIIDAVAPSSNMDMLDATQDSTSFEISWNASDDAGGSGVGNVLLFASENGGPFLNVASSSDSSTMFTGNNLSQYDFYTVAVDNVGNREEDKPAETSTVINASELAVLAPGDTNFCVRDSIDIRWKPGGVNYVNLSFASAADSNFVSIATALDSLKTPYTWAIPDTLSSGSYLIRVSDTSDLFSSIGDSIGIGEYPDVSLTANTAICMGDSIQLTTSGGTEYRWQAESSLSDTTVSDPWVSPDSTTTYRVEVLNQFGCGVMDSVTVTVNYPDTTYLQTNTCDTTQAGVFNTTLANRFGCDSLVINTVTYRPDYLTSENTLQVCQGDSTMIYGEYRSTAGTYYDTLQTQYGCDSVLSRELNVNPTYAQNLSAQQICQGDSAMIFGEYRNQAGVYYDSLTTISGCDSTLAVNLQVQPVFSSAETASICQGDSILLEGAYRKTAGTYVDVLTAVNGCDSTVTTTLNVLPNASSMQSADICQGDSIYLEGSWRTTAGTYVDVYSAANGCDSTVTTNLSITPDVTNSETARICQGDSLYLEGSWRKTAGSYVDVYPAGNGCDSTVTTNLIVDPSYDINSTASICQGDSIMLGGSWRNTAGVYTDTYQTAQGCDSLINTTLSVIPEETSSASASICAGDSIMIAGQYRTSAGAYPETLTAVTGCDSVHTVNLTVLPTKSDNVSTNICQGDSILLEGAYRKTAGTYVDVLTAENGCDSTVTTTLNVLPNASSMQSADICQGDSIYLEGSWRTTAGTYVDVYTAANGCDSTVTTNLSITPDVTNLETAWICQGDSIYLEGSWRKTAGTYMDVYPAANGCDSIVTTNLAVDPSYDINNTASICQGDSIMLGGSWRSTAGVYTDTYQTAQGCDSLINTTLTVIPEESSSASASICAGDSIMIAGQYRTSAGAYPETLMAVTGCDSVHTVNLTVLPNKSDNVSTSICQGDSILLGGSWRTTAGSYLDTLVANNGCDSVLTTNLTITPEAVVSQNLSICQGDSIQLGGSWQTTAGTYTDIYIGPNGCDSTVNTTLSVKTVPTVSASANICQGDSIQLGGSWQTTAGVYTDTYTAANGCDSIVNTTLSITPNVTNSTSASICQGDSILLGGSWQTTAGSYNDVYPASNGCDSIVTTTLSVLTVPNSSASVSICPGDSMLIAGAWRTNAGTYVDTNVAGNGCDSLHSVSVSLYPDYSQSTNTSICQGDSILLGGSWRTTAGTYVDSLNTINGCDSVITTTLSIQPPVSGSTSASICDGDSILLGGVYRTTAGSYVDTLATPAGCDSILTTNLSINTVDTAVSLSNAVLTANTSSATYRWIDCSTGQYVPGETGQSFAPTSNGVYACEVTQNGCTDTSSCYAVDDVGLIEGGLPEISYHPNPTDGVVNIDLGVAYGDITVTVIDGAGKRVNTIKLAGEQKFKVDLSAYADGDYFLQISTGEGSKVIKVIKD